MEGLKILQVVGYKDSGKTTLMLELVRLADATGKRVATVKHHGHSGALEMPAEGTDSMRLFRQGAASSIVYGDGVIQQHIRKKEPAVEGLIAMAAQPGIDLVLVEGFKTASYEKIAMVRSEDDWGKLKDLANIQLAIVSASVHIDGVQTIERGNRDSIAAWFSNWMEG
ncbi:molybdopterin-guanine dinucleotide biosynthesis protein B [Planococcus sp. FY231025]|uniref:molybdopterin-guanine dinucleotide biosynthesis protein B n=1 Tax=Planococcus sp. FY231025 TaxID=3455699 RepID=UPI003F902168